MTGFHEVRFPDAVARGATGGPAYSTAVVSFGGGFESRNQNWALARGRWDISTGIRTRAQMDEVIAFFRARKGRAHGFRFKDWQDFQAVDQPLAATADASIWQLVKRYESGGADEVRTVAKPTSGTVVVRIDGVVQTLGADYTIDETNGVATFTSPPAVTPRADFQFEVPVRFDTDHLAVTTRHFDAAVVPSIPIVELRV